MSAKNLDSHNRWRNKTVAFRVSPEEDSLIFPANAEHSVLQAKLDGERQRHDRLVRYQTDAEELQRLVPSLPILRYLSQVD